MILGDGTLANALGAYYGDVTFTWIAWDTPIRPDGTPDTKAVLDAAFEALDHGVHEDVIISSQLPVGTCATFEERWPQRNFYVVPENVRAAHAFEDWIHQPRIIVGARRNRFRFDKLWERITPEVIYTSPETAELTKHCLNGFLALCIQYSEEMARIAEAHGGDPSELAHCLQTDPRVGRQSYLKPGGSFGPHLTREIHNLAMLGGGPLIDALEQLVR